MQSCPIEICRLEHGYTSAHKPLQILTLFEILNYHQNLNNFLGSFWAIFKHFWQFASFKIGGWKNNFRMFSVWTSNEDSSSKFALMFDSNSSQSFDSHVGRFSKLSPPLRHTDLLHFTRLSLFSEESLLAIPGDSWRFRRILASFTQACQTIYLLLISFQRKTGG